MQVIGVDPSTKSGLVVVDGTDVHAQVLRADCFKGISRVDWLRGQFDKWLDERLSTSAINCAVIEGYAYANKFTLTTLVEIGVCFRLSMYNRGIPCYICPPSVLKREIVGKGNATKQEVAAAVKSRWGYISPSDDVVDAYCLAKLAQEIAHGKVFENMQLLS